MYHHISDHIEGPIAVSPRLFDAQLKRLYEDGWRTITVKTALDLLDQKSTPPEKTFILTFDDGYANFHSHAWPICKRYNAHACVYVLSKYMGLDDEWNRRAQIFSRHLSVSEIAHLATEGVEIGCHTANHHCLVKLNDAQLEEEITVARSDLQTMLKMDVDLFCYPYGGYNLRVQEKVARQFRHAFSVEEGNYDWHIGRFAANRIFVGPNHEPDTILRSVSKYPRILNADSLLPATIRKYIG